MKTLIIDDSPDAQAVARARLSKENTEIICAGGGREGLELARAERPDLVLLDLDMPDMSGFEVCLALKRDPALWMIPVIFLTGSGDMASKVKGLDMGAVDYVTKPFDAVELRARVRAALRTKRLQDLLATCAKIDPLTELGNRRALDEGLHQEWHRVQRYGGCFGFMMADLDHFKRINDTYGHACGDQVLREVASVLARHCRASDLVTRYGGEEFAVLLPAQDVGQCRQLAERCRQQIASTAILTANTSVPVTASFGVADSEGCQAPQDVLSAADAALYQAKQAGRNRVSVAAPALSSQRASADCSASGIGSQRTA
jgi:diguanylate cyclase (GGDEF)-like protein